MTDLTMRQYRKLRKLLGITTRGPKPGHSITYSRPEGTFNIANFSHQATMGPIWPYQVSDDGSESAKRIVRWAQNS